MDNLFYVYDEFQKISVKYIKKLFPALSIGKDFDATSNVS